MIHPFLNRGKQVAYYLLVWILVAGIHFFVLYLYLDQPAVMALADALVFNTIMAFLGLVLWYPVRYIDTEKNPAWYVFLNHLVAGLVTVVLWLSVSRALVLIILSNAGYRDFLDGSIAWRAVLGLMMYLGIILVYYLMVSYRNLEERTRNQSRLEMLVRESELNMLRAQINPHFLFNSLNSISSLALTDPPKANEMIIKLSEFLRYALDHDQHEKSALGEEISNIERYLHIEKVRFGDRLWFVKEVPAECLPCALPNLVLQPLFENAIKHGVYESTDPVTIRLQCCLEPDNLVITLSNNYDVTAIPQTRQGIGLKNISDRLALLYHREDLVRISRDEGIFKVILTIPQQETR